MKCVRELRGQDYAQSHPARGAWIEIFVPLSVALVTSVAPRKGCVD